MPQKKDPPVYSPEDLFLSCLLSQSLLLALERI